MLAEWVGDKSPEKLPLEAAEVARDCGYLPLALAMIGAMVRLRPSARKDALSARTSKRLNESFPGILVMCLLNSLLFFLLNMTTEYRNA
jgi:hypothetical protein